MQILKILMRKHVQMCDLTSTVSPQSTRIVRAQERRSKVFSAWPRLASPILNQSFESWIRNQDTRLGNRWCLTPPPPAPAYTACRGTPATDTAPEQRTRCSNVFGGRSAGDTAATYSTTDSGQLTPGIARNHYRVAEADHGLADRPSRGPNYLNRHQSCRCPQGAIRRLSYVPVPTRRPRVVAALLTGLSPSAS